MAGVDPKQTLGFWEKSLLRAILSTAALLFVCACASTTEISNSEPQAIVATVAEDGCNQPAVRIDSIVNMDSGSTIVLKDRFGPILVAPGQYAISVACQNPLDETRNKCVYWGHPNEYPTYKMPLSAGVKYTFRCFVEGEDISYRITEDES